MIFLRFHSFSQPTIIVSHLLFPDSHNDTPLVRGVSWNMENNVVALTRYAKLEEFGHSDAELRFGTQPPIRAGYQILHIAPIDLECALASGQIQTAILTGRHVYPQGNCEKPVSAIMLGRTLSQIETMEQASFTELEHD